MGRHPSVPNWFPFRSTTHPNKARNLLVGSLWRFLYLASTAEGTNKGVPQGCPWEWKPRAEPGDALLSFELPNLSEPLGGMVGYMSR